MSTEFRLYEKTQGIIPVEIMKASRNRLSVFYKLDPDNDTCSYMEINRILDKTLEQKAFENYVNVNIKGKTFKKAIWLDDNELLFIYEEKKNGFICAMSFKRLDIRRRISLKQMQFNKELIESLDNE